MKFETLAELYRNTISKYPANRSFSMYEREEMNYLQLDERVRAVQKILLEAGISSGDKVALLSNNMPNWGVCYFAAVISGMVIVPILPDFSGEELDMIIEHSEAKALMVSDKLYSKLSRYTLDRMNVVIRTKNLGIISQSVEEKGILKEPAADDTAAIIYTSGTTSKPKGVMLSHSNLCSQLDMVYKLFPVDEKDVFLSILPLSHTYECSFGMLYPFMTGASVVYLDRPPTATNLSQAAANVKPSIILSVPLIMEKIYKNKIISSINSNSVLRSAYRIKFLKRLIHRNAGKKLMDFFGGNLRFFGIGGAKLDATTERFLLDAKFPYAIGYGLTETAPLIAGAIPSKVKLQSTGPVLEGVQVRLENVNPITQEGEIVVLSPSTMKGYFKNPEATSDVFTADGWFRTKDLGYINDEGYLYIKGRLNNMIVGPSGENIYPEEIESVLNGHVLVADSIVKEEKGKLVALVNFNMQELEHKYQDLKDNLGIKMDEIKKDILNYVNSKVNRFSRISWVEEHNSDFEKTPTHKIKRYLYVKNNYPKKN